MFSFFKHNGVVNLLNDGHTVQLRDIRFVRKQNNETNTMAGREAVKRAVQQVRPILSVDREEARKRALNLYKAWYRQIPYIGECSWLCHRTAHPDVK